MVNKLLTMLFTIFLIVTFAGASGLKAQQQDYTVSGLLIDAQTGNELIGANVQIADTQFGVATDTDGQFEFSAAISPGTYTLMVRFIGYRAKEIEVEFADEPEIDLGTLELQSDMLGLDEVVVTGTTVPTERRELGNTISSVRGDDIELSGSSALDAALSGKVPGAQVNMSSGRPGGGVSVRLRGTSTVLGAAEPLYVVDGVIVNNDSPELIDIGGGSTNRLADINPNDIERIEVVKGAAAAALYGSRANNGVVQIFTKRGVEGIPSFSYNSRFTMDQIRNTLDVNEHPEDAAGNPVERYDHQDNIFRTAYGTEQSLSVSGGTEGTRYYISGSFLNNQGISDGNDYQRSSGRVRLDQDIFDWLDVSAGAYYAYSQTNEVPHGGVLADYGALTGFIFGPNTYDPSPDEEGNYPADGVLANPQEVIDRYDFDNEVSRFVGDFTATLTPFANTSIDYTLGYDTNTQTGKAFIPTGVVTPGQETGFSRRSTREVVQVNNDLNVRYTTNLTDQIESRTLLGGTLQYESRENIVGESSDLTPFIQVSPGGAEQTLGESRSEIVVMGAFLQETLNIADRFFVTAAGRFDASSVFGEEDRWQFYPKISSSYLISEEDYWRGSFLDNIFDQFTLRASIGESGGLTAIGPFDRFTTYSSVAYDGLTGFRPSTTLGREDISPERQREIEVGTEFSMLNDRIFVDFTYYDQHTEDLLLERSLAPTTGFSTALQNVGTLDNRGVEIQLRLLPIDRPDLNWTSTFNYSANRNEVDGVEGDVMIMPGAFGQVATKNEEPLGVFYSTQFERDADGNIVKDADGIPQAGDVGVIGDPNPDFIASWINEVNINDRWNFRAQFDASYGNDVFNFTRRLAALPAFGTLDDYEKELRGDLPEGYNAATFNIFENWVEDGSYIKLRELSASYSLYPELWGLESIRLSLIGRNLFSIDDYSGYDPEINVTGQSTVVRGFDFVEVPIPRSISFAINMNF